MMSISADPQVSRCSSTQAWNSAISLSGRIVMWESLRIWTFATVLPSLPETPAPESFHVSKSELELSIRTLESSLRIDFQIARDIDDDEKHVPDFVLETFAATGVVTGGNHLFEFRDFLLKLIENAFDVRPIKTDASGARGNMVCVMDG